MYSTYEKIPKGIDNCEAKPSDKNKVIIIGGGPNRIGQGIEFDYCCVHASYALRKRNIETIMINCNPETVSTDYDTSDRLYFEPLTPEDVIEIIKVEKKSGKLLGLILQFGGQTPLNLAKHLAKEKALSVSRKKPNKLVVGSDTIIIFQKKIINKAKTLKEARKKLKQLSY